MSDSLDPERTTTTDVGQANLAAANDPESHPERPRFNVAILTIALVAALLLIGYSNVKSQQENQRLKDENVELRDEIIRLRDQLK